MWKDFVSCRLQVKRYLFFTTIGRRKICTKSICISFEWMEIPCHLWVWSSNNWNALLLRRGAWWCPEAHVPQQFIQKEAHDTSQELASPQCDHEWLCLLRFSYNHPHRTQLLESKVMGHLAVQPEKSGVSAHRYPHRNSHHEYSLLPSTCEGINGLPVWMRHATELPLCHLQPWDDHANTTRQTGRYLAFIAAISVF